MLLVRCFIGRELVCCLDFSLWIQWLAAIGHRWSAFQRTKKIVGNHLLFKCFVLSEYQPMQPKVFLAIFCDKECAHWADRPGFLCASTSFNDECAYQMALPLALSLCLSVLVWNCQGFTGLFAWQRERIGLNFEKPLWVRFGKFGEFKAQRLSGKPTAEQTSSSLKEIAWSAQTVPIDH